MAEYNFFSLPENLLCSPDACPIRVEVNNNVVFKAYYCDVLEDVYEKYTREIDAYDFFNSLGVDFVPRLLAKGVEKNVLWFATPFSGHTLVEWCANASPGSMREMAQQLIEIDAWLYKHRVNYLEASPKDILVNENGRAVLIDFEYTFLNERFEQLLIERVDHERLKVLGSECCDAVRKEISAIKIESYNFLARKIVNSVSLRLGISRVQKSIRKVRK